MISKIYNYKFRKTKNYIGFKILAAYEKMIDNSFNNNYKYFDL
jgi:hypothetical protein